MTHLALAIIRNLMFTQVDMLPLSNSRIIMSVSSLALLVRRQAPAKFSALRILNVNS